MELGTHPTKHLTYCTNIHPGESWSEVREQLKSHVPELKRHISPDHPFGVGLRLSARAAASLLEEQVLEEFKEWLRQEDLYVFTMNGFPYGNFHRQRVKDLVYAPDWRTPERVEYTLNLTQILAELLPEDMDGGISTSPVSYKPWMSQSSIRERTCRAAAKNLAQVAFEMSRIREEQGKELHLDIEPEPDCLMENTADTVDFFKNWLFPVGSAYLSEEYGLDFEEGRELLQQHIRLCYDTCHFAVEYEDPATTLNRFREAGIRIGKTQISAALKVQLDKNGDTRRDLEARLCSFEEPVYLHQVIERRSDGTFRHYRDLSEALPNIHDRQAEEWRIHYHVPIFIDHFDGLYSTQGDITRSLQVLIPETGCRHFEIETYTWEVLPAILKTDVIASIEREFNWVLGKIGENPND